MSRVDIVRIAPDGTETVVEEWVKRKWAEAYLKGYNNMTDVTGFRVEMRSCDGEENEPTGVLVMPWPSNFKPSEPSDIPPGMDVSGENSQVEARAFARRFNELQLADQNGVWAVAMCDVPKRSIEAADADKLGATA